MYGVEVPTGSLIPASQSVLAPLDVPTLYPAVYKGAIAKADDERQMVFGWANIAVEKDGDQVVDAHADMIDPGDLENAAYEHVLRFRAAGTDHVGEAKGRLVESFVVTPEKLVAMGLAKDALPLGWWVGYKLDDLEVFAKVKSGQYGMFSIQGTAEPEMVDE